MEGKWPSWTETPAQIVAEIFSYYIPGDKDISQQKTSLLSALTNS